MTTYIHSPIRSPLRSPLFSPTVWKWGATVASAWATLLDSLQTETDGMVLYFTDPDYPRALIRDTTTPANDFDGDANDKLTMTSPNAKNRLASDGLIKYAAHNLFLNSASPATQNITVVSGALMKVIVTGSGSLAMTSAGSGTASAGSPASFTTTGTTLTCTLTGSLATVQVFYAPADEDYVATVGSAKYRLPIEYDTAGDPVGILVEEARTNLALYSSDFTNAAWTKSNMTTAKTATGPGGTTNGATTITATAANATALQAITSASNARITSTYIKRRTGTGNIDLTQDNGSTWTTVTVTYSWTRVNIAAATLANPTVGVRIVTSGDAVDIAHFQHEVGAFITSPIRTVAATVTRAADNISMATSAMPYSATAGSVVASFNVKAVTGANNRLWSISDGTNNERIEAIADTNYHLFLYDGGVEQASLDAGTIAANTNHKLGDAWAANSFAAVIDGGTVATDSGGTIPTVTTFRFASVTGALPITGHIKYIKYLPRRVANADLQTETAA